MPSMSDLVEEMPGKNEKEGGRERGGSVTEMGRESSGTGRERMRISQGEIGGGQERVRKKAPFLIFSFLLSSFFFSILSRIQTRGSIMKNN